MWVLSSSMILYSALIYVNSALSQYVYDKPDFYSSYFPIDKAAEYIRHDIVPPAISRRSHFSKASKEQIVNSHFKVKKSRARSFTLPSAIEDQKYDYDAPLVHKYKMTMEPKHYKSEDFIVEPPKIYSEGIAAKLDLQSSKLPPKMIVPDQRGSKLLDRVPNDREMFDFRFFKNKPKKMDGPVQMNVRKSQITAEPKYRAVKDRQQLAAVMSSMKNLNQHKIPSKTNQALTYATLRSLKKMVPKLLSELVDVQTPKINNRKRDAYLINSNKGVSDNLNIYKDQSESGTVVQRPCCAKRSLPSSDTQEMVVTKKKTLELARIGAEVENNDIPYALFYRSKGNVINNDYLKKAYVERFDFDASRLHLNSSQSELERYKLYQEGRTQNM